MNLETVIEIFLNHYIKARKILHDAIQKKLLPPTVYTTTRQDDGICWGNHITLCKAINTIATNSVCQTNNIDKIVIVNARISLSVSCIEAESESIWRQYFFQPVKSLINIKAKSE